MIILLFFAFVSGLITIFAPCIWPLLPIVLSSTTSGGHRKPLGITLGIVTSFAVFTLTISYLVKIIPFDPDILRYFAVAVIGFLGLSLIIPALSARLEAVVSRFAGSTAAGSGQNSGFRSGFITGFSLGIVWSPCAGPILATIATLAATRAVNIQIVLVTVAYCIGVGIPLFLFATVGQRFFTNSRAINKYTGRIQQVFGVVMIATALLILTGQDRVLQVKLLNAFPSYSSFITGLESNPAVKNQLDALKGKEATNPDGLMNKNINFADPNGLPVLGKAADFVGIQTWLNSNPLTISSLKGKVVLVDFWTYTCINCIRTLPYVTGWYEKYKDDGLVVVGVHTPEFEFEKKTSNVEKAIKQYKITYPVAQDNDYTTWNAYDNHYWPAKYLVDANGNVRYSHFGEGEYEQTEKAIQVLLKEAGATNIQSGTTDSKQENSFRELSPETYLGSARMLYLQGDGKADNGLNQYSLSKNLSLNHFSLGGNWNIENENALSTKNSVLEYRFKAQKVFLVMRPNTSGSKKVTVLLDGKPVATDHAGADVSQGMVTVDTDRLYELINIPSGVEEHTLRLEFQNEGTAIYAFTFG